MLFSLIFYQQLRRTPIGLSIKFGHGHGICLLVETKEFINFPNQKFFCFVSHLIFLILSRHQRLPLSTLVSIMHDTIAVAQNQPSLFRTAGLSSRGWPISIDACFIEQELVQRRPQTAHNEFVKKNFTESIITSTIRNKKIL